MKRSEALEACLSLYGSSSGRGKFIAVAVALVVLIPVAVAIWGGDGKPVAGEIVELE